MSIVAALESLEMEFDYEGSIDSSMDIDFAVEMAAADADMAEHMTDGDHILNSLDKYDAAVASLENMRAVIKEIGLSKGMMQIADPSGSMVAIGFPALENLSITPVHDQNATVALEAISDTLRKWGEAIKKFFIKIGNWLKGLFLKVKDMFTNYDKLLGNVRKAMKDNTKSLNPEKANDKKFSLMTNADVKKLAEAIKPTEAEFVKFLDTGNNKSLTTWVANNNIIRSDIDITGNSETLLIEYCKNANIGGATIAKGVGTLLKYLGYKLDPDKLTIVSDSSGKLKVENGKTLKELGSDNENKVNECIATAVSAVIMGLRINDKVKMMDANIKVYADKAGTLANIGEEAELKSTKAVIKLAKELTSVNVRINNYIIKAVKEVCIQAAKHGRAYLSCCQ